MEKLLTQAQVADILGVSPSFLNMLRAERKFEIAYVKVGNLIRFKESEVTAYIDRRSVSADKQFPTSASDVFATADDIETAIQEAINKGIPERRVRNEFERRGITPGEITRSVLCKETRSWVGRLAAHFERERLIYLGRLSQMESGEWFDDPSEWDEPLTQEFKEKWIEDTKKYLAILGWDPKQGVE